MMTKYQKIFIIVSGVIVIPVALIIFQSIFGGFAFNIFLWGLIFFILLHWLLYYLYAKSQHIRKWISFLPSIFFLVISLFLTYIVIRNTGTGCDVNDPGCMNEDFSGVFLFISITVTLASFCYSVLYNYLWFKEER